MSRNETVTVMREIIKRIERGELYDLSLVDLEDILAKIKRNSFWEMEH